MGKVKITDEVLRRLIDDGKIYDIEQEVKRPYWMAKMKVKENDFGVEENMGIAIHHKDLPKHEEIVGLILGEALKSLGP
jgi:hypothetical protein